MKASDAEGNKRGCLVFKVASCLGALKSEGFAELQRLTLEQLRFINHRLGIHCYLAACPGSGKTEVVGIKAAYEFSVWRSHFCGLAILTFTKNAAAEIRARVLKYGGLNAVRHPHFVGTFDSWLHNYVFQPFGPEYVGYTGREGDKKIGIIENDSRAGFLNNYMTAPLNSSRPVCANQFSYDAGGLPETSEEELATIIENGQNRNELDLCKNKFWQSGFATYQDAEFISYKVLVDNQPAAKYISKRFPIVIVDECQDLSPTQLKLLEKLEADGTAVHLVGDLDQAIYEFRNVDPALVGEYCRRNRLVERRLTNSFRSNQSIVDFCQKIISKSQTVKGIREGVFSPACALLEYADLTLADLPNKFWELISTLGLDPAKCAILARSRSTLSKVAPQKDVGRRPVELFASALNSYYGTSRKTDDLTNALEQIGKSISYLAFDGKGNHQRQYCPEHMNPVKWRLFLWELLRASSCLFPFTENGGKLTWTNWVAKLKTFLRDQWATFPDFTTPWEEIQTKVRAPSGAATKRVSESLFEGQRTARIRTTTIHDAKGETLDAVLLVSSPDKKSRGGHFEHWIKPTAGNEEHRRFAYVACSRPKHLLIIAAKQLKAKEKEDLVRLGLVPVPALLGSINRLDHTRPVICNSSDLI